MGPSDPWPNSLDIIIFHSVKKMKGMKPIGHSAPWFDSLEMISCCLTTVIVRGKQNGP